jgi:hypothetical protein
VMWLIVRLKIYVNWGLGDVSRPSEVGGCLGGILPALVFIILGLRESLVFSSRSVSRAFFLLT